MKHRILVSRRISGASPRTPPLVSFSLTSPSLTCSALLSPSLTPLVPFLPPPGRGRVRVPSLPPSLPPLPLRVPTTNSHSLPLRRSGAGPLQEDAAGPHSSSCCRHYPPVTPPSPCRRLRRRRRGGGGGGGGPGGPGGPGGGAGPAATVAAPLRWYHTVVTAWWRHWRRRRFSYGTSCAAVAALNGGGWSPP